MNNDDTTKFTNELSPTIESLFKLNELTHELLMIKKQLYEIDSQLCESQREFGNRYSQLDDGEMLRY